MVSALSKISSARARKPRASDFNSVSNIGSPLEPGKKGHPAWFLEEIFFHAVCRHARSDFVLGSSETFTKLAAYAAKIARSMPHDYHLGFQMGSTVCPGPGTRPARTLGAGRSRPTLQDAPPRTGRSGQTGISRAA